MAQTEAAIKTHSNTVATLMDRADQGDEAALTAMKTELQRADEEDGTPGLADRYLAEAVGDLDHLTQTQLKTQYFKNRLALQEGIECRMRQLRTTLEGSRPNALERLLIERILVCWIEVNRADMIHAGQITSGKAPLPQLKFYQHWQDRAHRRFLAACKALAQVRKLMGVNVQINIAEKQINTMAR
jgi:hypothetical protein